MRKHFHSRLKTRQKSKGVYNPKRRYKVSDSLRGLKLRCRVRTAQMLFCRVFSLHSSASAHCFATLHSLFVALTFCKFWKRGKKCQSQQKSELASLCQKGAPYVTLNLIQGLFYLISEWYSCKDLTPPSPPLPFLTASMPLTAASAPARVVM